MKHFLSAVAAILFPAVVSAQEAFSFSGYVAEFGAVMKPAPAVVMPGVGGQNQVVNILRIRLRPGWEPWENGQFLLEYEGSAYYQSVAGGNFPAVSENRRQVVNLAWNPLAEGRWRVMHCIDRLYYRHGLDGIDVTVGRQRIAWGTGRVWNPTDLFNPLNPAVVSKVEKEGVDAALVKCSFGNFTDCSLVFNPQRGWKEVNAGARFRTNVSEFDLSVMGGAFDRRGVAGADVAGNLFDAGVRGEGVVSFDPRGSGNAFSRFIIGADYQFTAELYGMIEYQRNGEGTTDRAQYDLVRFASGEILNLGRDYVAVGGTCLVHPLVTLALTVMRNLNDASGSLNGTATWSATDEFAVAAGVQIFDGSASTEYGMYPQAVYVKADVWF